MISKTMLNEYADDMVDTIKVLIGEIVDLRDALIETTESRDHWKARCEELEAANAQEAR